MINTTPNLIPNFKPENIVQAIKALTKKGLEVVSQAEKGDDWDSVITIMDNFECELGRLISVNSHLNAVMFDDKFNQQYEKTLPIITNFYSEIASNKNLYQAYKKLQNTDLNQQQQYILQEAIDDFKLSGVGLEGEKSKRFKAIKERLSLLSNQFAKNSLKSTSEWKKIVELSELKGYGEAELSKIKTDNGYELNLQIPVYMDIMTHLDNRELREKAYRAYISRASEIGITSIKYDNKPIMNEILGLKQEMANILDFDNYTKLSIESKY